MICSSSRGREHPLGAVVVLDVAGAAVGDRGDRLDRVERLRALELGQDRLDRAAEVVGEHAEPAAVGHPDHDLLGAVLAGQGRDLVEHRHDDVEALDREHLLAQVGLLEEALELEDLDQPGEQRRFSSGERRPVGAGLDHLPQPHPLLVRGEVLDLVRDRAAVRIAHPRQRVEKRLALDPDPQDRGRDPRHQLRGQVEVLGLERRVALRLAAERVEAAARWPWVRYALSSEVAAWTACSSSRSGSAATTGAPARGARAGQRRRRGGGGMSAGDRRSARRRAPPRPPRRSRPRPAGAGRCGAGRSPTRRPGSPGGRRSRSSSSPSRPRAP